MAASVEGGLTNYRWLLRTYMSLCLGCICHKVCCAIEGLNVNRWKLLLTAVEVLCYTTTLAFAVFWDGSARFDYVLILGMAVGITLSFSGLTYTTKIKNAKFASFCSKASLMIYLNHRYWCWFINPKMLKAGFWGKMGAYFALTFASSIICVVAVDFVKRRYERYLIKRKLIDE